MKFEYGYSGVKSKLGVIVKLLTIPKDDRNKREGRQ